MSMERRRLVGQTEGRMSTLKQALHTIETTKQTLRDNSVEVKSQIHAVVSRQLESLRNREVWLLGQVDVLEDTKEAVLRAQEAQLHHALGQLTNSLEYSQVDNDDGLHITNKLSRSLDRLNELELRPLESAQISFRADVSRMRHMIHDFGRIDSQGQALDVAFVIPGQTTSTSLPHTFEDYGDAEHHVLYKTLEDVKRERQENDCHLSIKVEIPRLARPMAEWLAWSPGTTPTPTPTSSKGGHFAFPPFGAGGTAIGSIQQWLANIKRETELEDEDFEVINDAGARSVSESSSMEVLNTSESEDATTAGLPYFEQVRTTPHADWLLQTGVGSENSAIIQRSAERLAYFQDAMETTEKWLAQFNDQSTQVAELAGGKTACCSGLCIPTTESLAMIDIENLADMLPCKDAIDYPVFKQVQQSSASLWLVPSASDDEKDIDEVMEVIQGVCRANEVCGSFSECISDENCSQSVSGASSRRTSPQHTAAIVQSTVTTCSNSHIPEKVQAWLGQPKNTAIMEDLRESPLFAYFHTLPTIQDHWLAGHSKNVAIDATQPKPSADMFPVFSSTCPPSVWLQVESKSSSLSCSPSHRHSSSTDVPLHPHMDAVRHSADCDWVRSESTQTESTTPDEACLTHFKYRNTSIAVEKQKWLSVRDPQCDTTVGDLPVPCPLISMPTSFSEGAGDFNQWLLPMPTPATSQNTSSIAASPGSASPLPTITTIPSPDTVTSSHIHPGTPVPTALRSHPPLTRNIPRRHQADIWLQKKSLSVEEDDLDVPLMSETVASSVSLLFEKMGLGHGPWLRVGDNRLSPAEMKDEEEEDDAHWLMKKESCSSLEKLAAMGLEGWKGELFSCFHDKTGNMSTWLSKTNLED